MLNWLRKSLLVFVTIVTFGLVTPQELLAENPNADKQPKRDIYEQILKFKKKRIYEAKEQLSERDRFINHMAKEAEEQAL